MKYFIIYLSMYALLILSIIGTPLTILLSIKNLWCVILSGLCLLGYMFSSIMIEDYTDYFISKMTKK